MKPGATLQDKKTEQKRYDDRAAALLSSGSLDQLGHDGAAGVALELRAPYIAYEAHIRQHAGPGKRLLDLCCGNGQHALLGAQLGAQVTVSDIAPHNVSLTIARARRAGYEVEGVIADAERLPFPPESFDVVTMAGSLSYMDLDELLNQVSRVLRRGGTFIFVDSLNHNPVYRLNRFLNYTRGKRTRSTLQRMPTMRTMEKIRMAFPDLALSFHGIFSFIVPVVRPLARSRTADWLDAADQRFEFLRRFAFKVVGVGHKAVTL